MSEEATRLVPGGGDSEAGNGDAPGRPDFQDGDMLVDDVEADSRDKQASTSLRPPPKKRRRTVISCTQCHRRKQKCDRKLPCANCIARHKQDSCEYESGAPTARELQTRRNAEDGAFSVRVAARPGNNDSHSSKPVNFGYSHTGASTLGFLQKLEDGQSPLSHLNPDNMGRGDHSNTRERYKTLIRQLPARIYIDKLVDIYFVEFNWQYQSLDRDAFDKQLQEWYRLPFSLLTTGGPQALDPHLRAFPALLFQVLALALLLLHSEADQVFESLKYAGNMTFDDLAMDYSESGMSILSLLGKRQMTITTVQTGFLRASFLKYVALVTESWHAIGSAIRDGQEIGLHRDSLDPKPANNTPEAILENQWQIQRRRKLWITLVWWDLHAAVVLGRPTTIDLSQEQQPTPPIDAKMNILATSSSPSSSSSSSLPSPLVPRTESDPPTPLTRLIFAIALGTQLRTIYTLEKTLGPNPHSFAALDALHAEFLSLETQTPPWLRLENPDTKFDALPECYWIPYARAQMPQMLAFNIMALHRPYIFTRQKSRTEALKASLGMLQAQRYHFSTLRPEHYKMFTLFFGTFDAIVIVAAVFILFSGEFGPGGEYVDGAVRQFGWAVERFRAMSGRNELARAALGVLKVLGVRFVRALGLKEHVIFGLGEEVERVPPPVTNAGLMPLPWGAADGDGSAADVTEGGVRTTTTPLTDGSGGPSSVSPAAAAGGGAGAMLAVADYYTAMKTTLQQQTHSISSSASTSSGHNITTHTPPQATTIAGNWTTTHSYNAPPSTSSMDTTTPRASTTVGGSNDNRTILLDHTGGASGGGGGSWDSNWNTDTVNIPSDFDWSSLQPIFATGDLLYNELQLHSTDGGGGAGWGGNTTGNGNGNGNNLATTSSSSGPDILWTSGGAGSVPAPSTQSISHVNMDNTAVAGPSGGGDMYMPLENRGNNHHNGRHVEHKQGLTDDQGNNSNNNMNPWLLDGDFGGHSFWSLLNQFGPPAPPPPPPGGGQ
ncbi:hypothetical protein V8F06_007465 [Rhypophila decipiens]